MEQAGLGDRLVDMLTEVALTPVERRLCEATVEGRLLDLRVRQADENHPARGPSWGPERQIRSQLLYQLLSRRGDLDETFGPPTAVRVRGAQIVGRLNLGGLSLRCPLELYECYLGGRLDLAKSEAADISLRGSHLARRMSARWLRLDHNLNLERLDCRGGVRLPGAHIGGQLSCTGANLANDGGRALNGDGLTVDSNLFLSTATVTGEVRLQHAHIGGQLACDGANLANDGGRALNGDGLTVDSGLYLSTATVTGEVRLLYAHIGGQLACNGATLANADGLAVDLERAVVDGTVYMSPNALRGGIDLTHARVGGWYDAKDTWPTWLRLEGFTYDAIDAPGVSARSRLRWVERHRGVQPGPAGTTHQGGYTPQPYEQLAAVYRRAGHENSARTVAIAKQQARRAASRRWWVRWPSSPWSIFLRWTIGYGYRPTRVLPYFLALLLLGAGVLGHAYPRHIIPAKSGSGQPAFHAVAYTLDLLLPVANLKQRDAFIPDGYAFWWVLGLTLTGWLLAAVVLAGLSGVFKRD
jgi:hypothetical protein